MDAGNMKHLKSSGAVVCLWAEPEEILERTRKYSHRPLLNVENPLEKIRELIARRSPFYEKADYHIKTSGISAEEAALKIERIAKNAERSVREPKAKGA